MSLSHYTETLWRIVLLIAIYLVLFLGLFWVGLQSQLPVN